MATKLGRTVTYLERLPLIQLLDLLVTWPRDKLEPLWSCGLARSRDKLKLPQCLWPPYLANWWLTLRAPIDIVT